MKTKVRVCAIAFAVLATLAVPLAKTAHSTGKVTTAHVNSTRPIATWFDGNNPNPPGQHRS